MNTKIYEKEEITAYLLGLLPEEDAERLDELSFTDDEFADELMTAEKDLVDGYVNNELEDEKRRNFEFYYLASPLRREKVEFAKAFQTFVKDKTPKLQTEKFKKTEEKSKEPRAGFFSRFLTIPRLSMQWGFAFAALMFLLFGSWAVWENSRLRNEISRNETSRDELLKHEAELENREKELRKQITSQSSINSENEKELIQIREAREKLAQELKIKQSQEQQREQLAATQKQPEILQKPQKPQPIILSFVLSPTLRGNNQLQTLTIPTKTDSIKMRLELESDDYAFYRVAMQNQSTGQILWKSGKIKSKSNGKFLNINFPANLLQSQVYSIEVSGISNEGTAEIIGDYSFRVVR